MSTGPDEPNEQGTSNHERGTSSSERGTKAAPQKESKLVGLTVIAGATQGNVTGQKNWAAVKKSGADVLVKAETSPDNDLAEWKKIRWTTGNAVPGQPNQRKISRATSKKYHVEASLGGSSAYVDIWIIWAKILIMTSGRRPANAAPFDPDIRFDPDRLGVVTYPVSFPPTSEIDGEEVDNWAAAGRICAVASLTPKKVSAVIRSGWVFEREVQCRDFIDDQENNIAKSWKGEWVNDRSLPNKIRRVPDDQDKIYDIDGPDIIAGQSDSYETYNNFRQWIEFDHERCSDFALWFWRARWKLNRDPRKQMTLKELGTGQIKLPTKAHYRSK
jgi:hypothetical protein